MSFLDKVKQTASQVAAEAKKGTAQVQTKIEQGQIRKKADEAAKQLGYLIVKERTEGTPAGDERDRLVSEIVALEEQLAAAAKPAEGEEEGGGAAPEAPAPPASEPAGE